MRRIVKTVNGTMYTLARESNQGTRVALDVEEEIDPVSSDHAAESGNTLNMLYSIVPRWNDRA